MKQSIKEDFRNFKIPKGTTITVNEADIEITSTNTNYYTIGFYIFLFCIVLAIGFVSSEMIVIAVFGTPLIAFIVINLLSKVEIKLSDKSIEIKDGFFLRHIISVYDIEEITFGGTTKTYASLRVPANSATISTACTHVKLKSGQTLDVFKSAENQKFMFRCLSYFVEKQ